MTMLYPTPTAIRADESPAPQGAKYRVSSISVSRLLTVGPRVKTKIYFIEDVKSHSFRYGFGCRNSFFMLQIMKAFPIIF